MNTASLIGIIGSGSVATHFAHYFNLKDIQFTQWSRKHNSTAEFLEFLKPVEAVLILIKDSEIEPFIKSHPELLNKKCIHFSGALVTPLAVGIHPLMTFGSELYSLELYESISFVGEKGRDSLSGLLPALRNRYFEIPPNKKAYYHSLCVMSGNFTVLLWQKIFKELNAQFKIPFDAAQPYMNQIFQNLSEDPFQALTGPISRKDFETINKNIKALDGDSFQAVYQSFLYSAVNSNVVLPQQLKEGRNA